MPVGSVAKGEALVTTEAARRSRARSATARDSRGLATCRISPAARPATLRARSTSRPAPAAAPGSADERRGREIDRRRCHRHRGLCCFARTVASFCAPSRLTAFADLPRKVTARWGKEKSRRVAGFVLPCSFCGEGDRAERGGGGEAARKQSLDCALQRPLTAPLRAWRIAGCRA